MTTSALESRVPSEDHMKFWLARQTTWAVDHILSTPGLSDDDRIAILGGTAGRTGVCYFGRRSHGRW